MCKAIEDMRNEAAAEAAALAEQQSKTKIAMQFLVMGVGTPEQIAQATGLTLDEVKEIAKSIQAPASQME